MALVLLKLQDNDDEGESFNIQCVFDPPMEEGSDVSPTLAQQAALAFLDLVDRAQSKADADEVEEQAVGDHPT